MSVLHGKQKKVLFTKLGRYEVYAEVPTTLKDLARLKWSREDVGSDTHINICGVYVLISKT